METLIILGIVVAVLILILVNGVKVVEQSNVYVIERFGKKRRILDSGLNIINPLFDKVAHKVSILERQLPDFNVSVISRDNVEIELTTTVFYRIKDAAKAVYRIEDVDKAILTTATSIIRSAGGKLELDELQSAREHMASEILKNLSEAAEIWGIEITTTAVVDIIVDQQTKQAQRQQLSAERERRATVTKAEGDKTAVQLNADAVLYEATKTAEAVKIAAEAEAHATRIVGEANAVAIKAQGEVLKANTEFIGLEKARQWDGTLPQTYITGDKTPNMLFQLDGQNK